MDRLVPWAAGVVLVALMSAPALVDPPADGFPLSTYPMFAADPGEQVTLATAVGRTRGGDRIRLSPRILAGADEPILAVRTARVAVGSGAAAVWCDEVAARSVGLSTSSGEMIERVEVVSETHHVRDTLVNGRDPLRIEVHAECEVTSR
jgi:hypothetical protein